MRSTAELRRAVLARTARVVVIGQGYVGLTLACAAADEGFPTIGVDIDAERVARLSAGEAVVPGVDPALFASSLASGRLRFTTWSEPVADAAMVFICVPTPLRDGSPDLRNVEAAVCDVAERLRPGSLVVLESTTYPGTTEELVAPLLERPGRVAGRDFLLAYSPERIDPGNGDWGMRTTPRVVGGISAESTGVATLFYEQLVDKVMPLSSCRAAELAKLLENTYRHVNIGLVNEMAIVCHETGIDVWEVLAAAATKPFGYMPFEPGPGIGGHCIPLDPAYLAWQVRRDTGRRFRILEQAEDVNAQMPGWTASRIAGLLNDQGRSPRGAKVLVLGVTYKPDVGDLRESPSIRVMEHLHRLGVRLSFHDPYIDRLTLSGGDLESADLTARALRQADCVALLTPHEAYDRAWIVEHASAVFDARNALAELRSDIVVAL